MLNGEQIRVKLEMYLKLKAIKQKFIASKISVSESSLSKFRHGTQNFNDFLLKKLDEFMLMN